MKTLIPVTIVTGFLGSGKTTLLRSLIEHRQTRRLALLINEFGEVAIDGALIRETAGTQAHIQIVDFPYGLIAYGDDALFIPTMQAIAARRFDVDHVLIETSGLALPTAVMEMLQSAELADDFILDATLAIVDTPLLLSNQFDVDGTDDKLETVANSVAALFERQLEYADVVVLNKIDGLDDAALLLAETALRQRAPNIRFLELAYDAKLDIRLALGLRLHQPTKIEHAHSYTLLPSMPGPQAGVLDNQSRLNGHAHSGLSGHSHGLRTHQHFHEQDPGWLSFVLRCDAVQHEAAFKAAMLAVSIAEPVLRSKGFICLADAAGTLLVQGVRTRLQLHAATEPGARTRSELVFIGYHLKRQQVAAKLSELTGTLWQ